MKSFSRAWDHASLVTPAAALMVNYVRVVGLTSRIEHDPAEICEWLDSRAPAIIVTWHGQLGLMPLILRPNSRFVVLTTKHRDGALAEAICKRLGVTVVRATRRKPGRNQETNGSSHIRQLLRHIDRGYSIGITADAPKKARMALGGAIMLAQLSGRPIVPVAAVTNRRFDLDTWDRASIPMPFGHCCICAGDPITFAADAHRKQFAELCADLTDGINAVFRQAFTRIKSIDPGGSRYV